MNKKRGNLFEKEWLKILKDNRFWATYDKGYSQSCDIVAGKNNKILLFECKVCIKDFFNLERVEVNQNDSRKWFELTGNEYAYFVYKIDGLGIYLSRKPIKKPSDGIMLERWLKEWI